MARVQTTAAYAPDTVRTNADLERMLGHVDEHPKTGTSDEWIRERTGFIERRITTGESQYDMAKHVTDQLLDRGSEYLEQNGIHPEDVSIIVIGNTHDPFTIPCRAAEKQDNERLNKRRGNHSNVPAFDIAASNLAALRNIINGTSSLTNGYLLLNRHFPGKKGIDHLVTDTITFTGTLPFLEDSADHPYAFHRSQVGAVIDHTIQESLAERIAHERGINYQTSFDLSAGCAGFNFGLAIADHLINNEPQAYLVIAVDKMLDVTNPQDRSTVVLFGEYAAGALLVPGNGFTNHFLETQGDKRSAIYLNNDGHFTQEGRAVMKAVRRIIGTQRKPAYPGLLGDILSNTTGKPDLVIHQSNMRVIDEIQANYGDDFDTIYDFGRTLGNGSCASVAYGLHLAMQRNAKTVALLGMGAGFSDGYNILTK